MESCEMCCGLRGHERLRDALFTELDIQYQKARDEYKLLQALFRDCCWYNFETACRSWQDPWHVSWEQSMISLDGMRVETDRNSLKITYPIWYRGVVRDAPDPTRLGSHLDEDRRAGAGQTRGGYRRQADGILVRASPHITGRGSKTSTSNELVP